MKGIAILTATVLVAIGAGVGVVGATASTTAATPAVVGRATACVASSRLVCITNAVGDKTTEAHVGEHVDVVLETSTTSGIRLSVPRELGPQVLRLLSASSSLATFVATRTGSTTLQATGTPICDAHEACPMFVLLWRAKVVVLS